jgi:hypothetical protein
MLEKLKNAIGASEKASRDREISRIGYSEEPSRLVVEFSDGSMHTHLDVIEGHIVGLRIAEDKLDFYESQIEPSNRPLEAEGAGQRGAQPIAGKGAITGKGAGKGSGMSTRQMPLPIRAWRRLSSPRI